MNRRIRSFHLTRPAALAAGLLLLSGLSNAVAQTGAATPRPPGTAYRAVMEAARSIGPVKMSTTNSGAPLLTGEMDGLKYGIFFSGCDARGENCEDMRLVSYWDESPVQALNTWNRTKYVGRAYLDGEGTTLDLWVNLLGGLSTQQIVDVLEWWDVAVNDFAAYLKELK